MKKPKVLFVCVHNSARSQMAEAFLNTIAGERFDAMSAGFKQGKGLNPLAIRVMDEIGIDISQNTVKSVDELHAKGDLFDYAIVVCDTDMDNQCGIVFGIKKVFKWSFRDPEGFTGSEEEKLGQARILRDIIKGKIEDWVRATTV